jgi:hypothetical protein
VASSGRVLSYDLTPSPRTVFGCLLPAPWAGVIAGLLLAFGPQAGVPDQFSPLVLAVVHWLVLGMLMPIMIGAMFQMFPVIAGQPVPGSARIAPFVALTGSLAALCLSIGFLGNHQSGFMIAATLALLLLLSVGSALALGGYRVVAVDATTATFRLIALPVVFTLSLGAALATILGGYSALPFDTLLSLHIGWALVGWVGTLLISVATTVVPMFWQIPKPYPLWQKILPWSLWLPLLLATLMSLLQTNGDPDQLHYWWSLPAAVVLLLGAIGFASLLRAQRRFDPAWPLWVCAALGWVTAAILFILLPLLPSAIAANAPWWIGICVLVAGAVAPINAMLGKIIPFLVFLHLRRALPGQKEIKSMHEIVSPRMKGLQAYLLLFAILVLLAVPLAPSYLATLGGLLFSASQTMLGVLLIKALMQFRSSLRVGRETKTSST